MARWSCAEKRLQTLFLLTTGGVVCRRLKQGEGGPPDGSGHGRRGRRQRGGDGVAWGILCRNRQEAVRKRHPTPFLFPSQYAFLTLSHSFSCALISQPVT